MLINCTLIDSLTGTRQNIALDCTIIKACSWYMFELDYNGEPVYSDHCAKTRSGLILDSQAFNIEFII